MATATLPPATLAELLERIGDVAPDRIRLQPPPGTATPADVLALADGEPKRLCELVEGVLVEKAMGHQESRIAMILGQLILNYLQEHDLGIVTGADGPHHLDDQLVRFPDVAFIPYDNIPTDADPETPMPDWVPALAVEVFSRANTKSEMDRKRQDYFDAGVRLVWYVDPKRRTISVYTSPDEVTVLTEDDTLDGADVLPGFQLSIRDWLDRASRLHPPP